MSSRLDLLENSRARELGGSSQSQSKYHYANHITEISENSTKAFSC